MVALRPRLGIDALGVESCVHRVRADLAGMELAPDVREADVVLTAAERARAVPRGERRRLVEEEELGEAAGLEEGGAPPAAELEPACDPALAVVSPPYPASLVVQAAAISVHETARGVGDQLARRGDAVSERHPAQCPLTPVGDSGRAHGMGISLSIEVPNERGESWNNTTGPRATSSSAKDCSVSPGVAARGRSPQLSRLTSHRSGSREWARAEWASSSVTPSSTRSPRR